jgi:hypothetical protein
MRFSFRNESFPTWDLAPSDVKEGVDSVVALTASLWGALVFKLEGTNAVLDETPAEATVAKRAMLLLILMSLCVQ